MSSKKKDGLTRAVESLHRLVLLIECLPFTHQLQLMKEVSELQDGVFELVRERASLKEVNKKLIESRVKDLEEILAKVRFASTSITGNSEGGEKN